MGKYQLSFEAPTSLCLHTSRTPDRQPVFSTTRHDTGDEQPNTPPPSPPSQESETDPLLTPSTASPPPDTPTTPSIYEHEHTTFKQMLARRRARITAALCTNGRPMNPFLPPPPWTLPTWEHAKRYPDIVAEYLALENRVDFALRDQLQALRHRIVELSRTRPPWVITRATAAKLASDRDMLSHTILRARLSDAVREDDAERRVDPPRMLDQTPLLSARERVEEKVMRGKVEEVEAVLEEAIRSKEAIGEFALEEENVTPITRELEWFNLEELAEWPEMWDRVEKAMERERKMFPGRF